MNKIKQIKNQKQELERLKQIDKDKKYTFILEQKLKKLERYKFLLKKITDIECAMTKKKNLTNEQKIIKKQIESDKIFDKIKTINTSNIINRSYTPDKITPKFNINENLKKVFAYINYLGFLPIGENIQKNKIHTNNLNINNSNNINNNSVNELNNNQLEILNKLQNYKYSYKTFKPKYYLNDIKYFNLDSEEDIINIFNNISYNQNANLHININTSKKNNMNFNNYINYIFFNNVSRTCNIPRTNILNESLKNNNYNICKCYFNEYNNNLNYQKFIDTSSYFKKISISNIIDLFIHSNRNISKSIEHKYYIINFMNSIYQGIDKNLNILFI